MFYINKHKLLTGRENILVHIVPTIVVFLSFFMITLYNWSSAKSNSSTEINKSVQQQNSRIVENIRQRINTYDDMLRGGAGLFYASEKVKNNEWQNYFSPYKLQSRYPGIGGIGYIQIVSNTELNNYVSKIRADEYPNYTVFPSGERSLYACVVFVYPLNKSTEGALGYDMLSEKVRKNAIIKARDSGTTTLSDIVTLLKNKDNLSENQGFLMYYPIYDASTLQTVQNDRKEHIKGFVYAPLRTDELINKIIQDKNDFYEFKITNKVDNTTVQNVYTSSGFDRLINDKHQTTYISTIRLPNAKWEITGIVTPDIIISDVKNKPSTSLWGGLLFSVLIAGFIYLLLGNRARALADKEEFAIKQAKDELLALASHQLRTPATGVKQYIGMVREGFAGKVSSLQRELLDKAYFSNERQLSTINEMLIVAKADSGHLEISLNIVDVGLMIKEIIDEQAQKFALRKQKVKLFVPNNIPHITGDPLYLRMAFENVISNATKYTRDGGRITITLKNTKNTVICCVKDTGVGVSSDDYPLLFEKFSRIPNDLTNKVSGSGIGLYLARAIIEKHNGTIEFNSIVNKGSTVVITLPKTFKHTNAQ